MYRTTLIEQLNNMFDDLDDGTEIILRGRRIQAVNYLKNIQHHVLTVYEVSNTFAIIAGL